MAREIVIGDWVRATPPGKRTMVGQVTREWLAGTCWVVRGRKGEDAVHKGYCVLAKRKDLSLRARADVDASRREVKPGKIFGDGEV